MTTWTPKTQDGENWNADPSRRVFSGAVFSHSTLSGLRVFAINGIAVVTTWTAKVKQAETWSPD